MDLVTGLRRRVLELLDGINPPSRYKVVVVDKRAKRLLDLVVDKSELLNRQVANVLLVDEMRPTEPYLDAVYIVEQSSYSFGCIDADFAHKPPRYAGAHVFLLPRWRSSESERERFEQQHTTGGSTDVSKATNTGANGDSKKMVLRQIGDAPLAFAALESRLFTLEMPHANLILYNEGFQNDVMGFVEMTGQQIAYACESLGVAPYVRYTTRYGASRANVWPTLVARAALKHIEERRAHYMTPAREQNRATLIVLDRTVDIGAPLRHEALFQALSMDVTDGKGAPPAPASEPPAALGGHTLGIKFEDFKGGYPTEKDKLWTSLRHKHIVAATQELTTRLRELRAANPHFEESAENVSVTDVRNMLAALPEFMKERESVGLNLDLAQECISAIEQPQLQALLEFEQSMELGTDEHGEYVPESRLADALVSALGNSSADSITKVRALALYALHRHGLRASDYTRLQKHARLRDGDLETIKAMGYLGVPMEADPAAAATVEVPPPLTRELPRQALRYHRIKPGVQTVVEQALSGELSETEYPYAGDVPDQTQEALSTATSLRNRRQKATWAQNVADQGGISSGMMASTSGSASSASSSSGPTRTLIVFIVGGVTPSEAAAIYSVAEATGVSIIIGSHDFLTPKRYVDFLTQLHTPRTELSIPEDQPLPHVPEFLTVDPPSAKPAPTRPATKPLPKPAAQPAVSAGGAGPSKPEPQANQLQAPVKAQKAPHVKASKSAMKALAKVSHVSSPTAPPPKPVQKAHTQPVLSSSVPGTAYGDSQGIQYLGTPPPAKEKKDMKDRLKGAFRLKR